MVRNSLLMILITLLLSILVSCLTVEADILIDGNGSGRADLRYNLSTLAMDVNAIDEKKQILPFPILEREYETAAQGADGISIEEYELRDDGTRSYVNSSITFNSLENLSIFTGISFQSESVGNNTLLTVDLYNPPKGDPVSEKSLNLVKEKFPLEFFSISITIPGDIIRVEGATFSGSDVLFKINVDDLLSRQEPVSFSVEYR